MLEVFLNTLDVSTNQMSSQRPEWQAQLSTLRPSVPV